MSKKRQSNINTSTQSGTDYDIVISGGGVVGCLMALALAKQSHFRVLLLEAHAPSTDSTSTQNTSKPSMPERGMPGSSTPMQNHPRFDARVIALGAESLRLLSRLGVDINNIVNQAINQIHVSDRGHMGQVRLHADDYKLSALGHVVAIKDLGEHLLDLVSHYSEQIHYSAPVTISSVEQCREKVTMTLSDGSQTEAKLLIVSDGGQSKTAALIGMQSQVHDYGQSAIITNIRTQVAHKNIAYERFTSEGPIALLPMNTSANITNSEQTSMSVVWCMHTQKIDEHMALSESDFLLAFGKLFGDKLGKFLSCSERFSYPLLLNQKVPFILNRAIAVGNAAQTLHPIAGQGFNLGIRDVEGLIQTIKHSDDPGNFALLQKYKQKRTKDKQATIGMTNTLLSVFSNQHAPMVVGRNLALLAMNKSNYLKKQFAHFAMGVRKKHD